jgi:hypothetical protein
VKCPYCRKFVIGITGHDELYKFHEHLGRCKRNPNNVVMTDGVRTVVTPRRVQGIGEALDIRAKSKQ